MNTGAEADNQDLLDYQELGAIIKEKLRAPSFEETH